MHHRRSSSPEIPIPEGAVHAARRQGGPRREATERVDLRGKLGDKHATGWTLNISRGGARLVLEEAVEPGEIYDLTVGTSETPREVRIIWVQDEQDGQIAGVQFLDTDGSLPPAESAPSNEPPSGLGPKSG